MCVYVCVCVCVYVCVCVCVCVEAVISNHVGLRDAVVYGVEVPGIILHVCVVCVCLCVCVCTWRVPNQNGVSQA